MAYEVSTDRERIDRDWVWRILSTEAYWMRWRTRCDVEAQLDGAWRLVGAYESASGAQVAFARAFSDGIAHAYLSDVIVDSGHRGRGLGRRVISAMIDDPAGQRLQWMLATEDAHSLYEEFGFAPPDGRMMVRRSRGR
jgi:GNAT superfamily N-acetyltransferase